MSSATPEKCPKCGGEMTVECDGRPMHVGRNWPLDDYSFCLESQRDQLAERVRVLEACRSWRPIQTCPHNLEWVLGYDEKDGETGMIIYDWETTEDFTMRSWTDGMRTWTPTHWMPLPEPPKEKGAQ